VDAVAFAAFSVICKAAPLAAPPTALFYAVAPLAIISGFTIMF